MIESNTKKADIAAGLQKYFFITAFKHCYYLFNAVVRAKRT